MSDNPRPTEKHRYTVASRWSIVPFAVAFYGIVVFQIAQSNSWWGVALHVAWAVVCTAIWVLTRLRRQTVTLGVPLAHSFRTGDLIRVDNKPCRVVESRPNEIVAQRRWTFGRLKPQA